MLSAQGVHLGAQGVRIGAQGVHLGAQGVGFGAQGATVSGLSADSRSLRAGDVFVAYPGHSAKVDGRTYIGDAIAQGAAAVLWEREGFEWNPGWRLPNVGVTGLKPLVGAISSEVYGKPSEQLFMAGVTGTNGKTSVAQWIAQALEICGDRKSVV